MNTERNNQKHGVNRSAFPNLQPFVTENNRRNAINSSKEIKQDKSDSRPDEDLFFELSPDLLCIIGFDGHFKKVNNSFARSFGFTKADFLGRPVMGFLHGKKLEEVSTEFSLIKNGLPTTPYETCIVCKDGSEKWISWQSVAVEEKQIIYTTGSDVTEEKKVKNQLYEQKEHLQNLIKHKTDGLLYASFLQEAVFHDPKTVSRIFPDSFIFHSVKDILSGDFYWFDRIGNKGFMACADCTGHGVPGAILSMIGINKLHEIISSLEFPPSQILDKLNSVMYKALGKKFGPKQMYDGMDIALFSIDFETKLMNYAAANNPIYIIRNGNLVELEADKQCIGSLDHGPFTDKTYQLMEGDMIYVFSDGYADQFGGPHGKKFMRKNFKNLLISISDKDSATQKDLLQKTLTNWKGDQEQTDDICVIGVRVS